MNVSNMQISNPFFQMGNIGNNGVNMGIFNNKQNMEFELKTNEAKSKKINIIFKDVIGRTKLLIFNYGDTINDIMVSYLNKIGRSEYINTDFVRFIYNASALKFGDETKIEKYFEHCIPHPPTIIVYDTYNHPL